MNQLLIDIGNTSIKWCISSAGVLHDCDSCLYVYDLYKKKIKQLIEQTKLAQVLISSVLVPNDNAAFNAFLNESGVPRIRWFLKASDTQHSIHTKYTDPAALGVDRYLAMLAAYEREQHSVIVIDVGTATTIDYVSTDREHLGGVILPGLEMMAQSFSRKIVRLSKTEWAWDDIPLDPLQINTLDGLNHGLRYAWVGGITKVLFDMTQIRTDQPTLFLTGGNAQLLASLLGMDAHIDKQLVLKGLALQLEKS